MSNYIIYDSNQYAETKQKENGFFRKYTFKNIKEFRIDNNHFHDCIFENVIFSSVFECSFTTCYFHQCKFDNICGCDFKHSTIKFSDFQDSSLWENNFLDTIFKYTDFSLIDITYCIFKNCNFMNNTFNKTNIDDTFFINANVNKEKFFNSIIPLACPDVGSFIGWKKGYYINSHGETENCIIKLEIPEDAKRSSATDRKCRCNKAKVLEIQTIDGEKIDAIAYSHYLKNTDKAQTIKYKAGEMVHPDKYDDYRFIDCTSGIHFFITRNEAVKYFI